MLSSCEEVGYEPGHRLTVLDSGFRFRCGVILCFLLLDGLGLMAMRVGCVRIAELFMQTGDLFF